MFRPLQHQLASAVLAGLLSVGAVSAQTEPSEDKQVAPDNTEANKADRDDKSTTPIDQSNDKDAIEVTAAIRRAVMDDKSLSTAAHNVKIVTEGNTVTLRGAVESAAEKSRIEALAIKSARGKQVRNQISVSG